MHMLTTQEAAQRLGCSAGAIRRQCLAGLIPGAVKHGRDWLVPEHSLSRLVIRPRKRLTRAEKDAAPIAETP